MTDKEKKIFWFLNSDFKYPLTQAKLSNSLLKPFYLLFFFLKMGEIGRHESSNEENFQWRLSFFHKYSKSLASANGLTWGSLFITFLWKSAQTFILPFFFFLFLKLSVFIGKWETLLDFVSKKRCVTMKTNIKNVS